MAKSYRNMPRQAHLQVIHFASARGFDEGHPKSLAGLRLVSKFRQHTLELPSRHMAGKLYLNLFVRRVTNCGILGEKWLMLYKPLIVTLCIVCLSLVSEAQQNAKLKVIEPNDEARVQRRLEVKGTLENPKDKDQVWVIVRPLEAGQFWVQPKISIRGEGKWSVDVYIGRSGSVDEGKSFEIRAVLNPKEPLKDGDILGDWPDAEAQSQVVGVTRAKK
jgi:hypothetical protein